MVQDMEIYSNIIETEGIKIKEKIEKIKDSYVYTAKAVSIDEKKRNPEYVAYNQYREKQAEEGDFAVANLIACNYNEEFYNIQETGWNREITIKLAKEISKYRHKTIITRLNKHHIIIVEDSEVFNIIDSKCYKYINGRRYDNKDCEKYIKLARQFQEHELNMIGLGNNIYR